MHSPASSAAKLHKISTNNISRDQRNELKFLNLPRCNKCWLAQQLHRRKVLNMHILQPCSVHNDAKQCSTKGLICSNYFALSNLMDMEVPENHLNSLGGRGQSPVITSTEWQLNSRFDFGLICFRMIGKKKIKRVPAGMGNRRLDGSLILPLTSPPVTQILHRRSQSNLLGEKNMGKAKEVWKVVNISNKSFAKNKSTEQLQ